MRRRLRLFGHPVHPMVAGLPVAFWLGGFTWDLVSLVAPGALWPGLAFWTLTLGVAAAVPAAASGLWDFACLPADHPGERVAWWHLGSVSGALGCVAASLVLRWPPTGDGSTAWPAVVLAGAGALLTLAGGWLGGELVFRHGVAVEGRDAE